MGEIRKNFNILEAATPAQLLAPYADILDELRQRGIARSANAPVGDYAEYLVAKALGLELSSNSTAGYDATGALEGIRYQVKGRRLTGENGSRQLGAIRNLPARNFDYLAGVLFAEDFSIARACLIPVDVVAQEASYVAHTNSWRLMLRDGLWGRSEVQDITDVVRAAALGTGQGGGTNRISAVPEVANVSIEPTASPATMGASTVDLLTAGIAPKVTYNHSRFCFKAVYIEPLDMADAFRMVTADDGVFQMTKAEFYRDFSNVPPTASYRGGLYHSRKPPQKALRYRISL